VIHAQLEQEYGAANFEAFINLMAGIPFIFYAAILMIAAGRDYGGPDHS